MKILNRIPSMNRNYCALAILLCGCSKSELATGQKQAVQARPAPVSPFARTIPDAIQKQAEQILHTPSGFESKTNSDAVDLSLDQLGKYFGTEKFAIPPDPDGHRQKLIALLQGADRVLAGVQPIRPISPDVHSGQKLPEWFDYFRDAGEQQTIEQRNAIFSPLELYVAAISAGALLFNPHLLAYEDIIPELAGPRSQKLPPTTLDVAVYVTIENFTQQMSRNPESLHYSQDKLMVVAPESRPKFEAIAPYAKAKNPVYRLLALKIATRLNAPVSPAQSMQEAARTNPAVSKTLLEFYRQYLEETDPAIVKLLIEQLANAMQGKLVDRAEAGRMLLAIRDRQAKLGVDRLVQEVDSKLETIR
jgi:hypothetical protein